MTSTWQRLRQLNWILIAVVILLAALVSLSFSLSVEKYGELKNELLVLALPLALPFVLSQQKARFSLYVIFFFLPVIGLELPPRELQISIYDLMLVFMLVMYFLKSCEENFRPFDYLHLRQPLLVALLFSLLSALFSEHRIIALYDVYVNLTLAAFYWMFVQLVETTRQLKIICGLIVVGLVACLLLGLAQDYLNIGVNLLENQNTSNTSYQDVTETVTRVYGPFESSTDFAQYMLVPIFLLLGLIFAAKKWWIKVVLILCFAMAAWVLMLTLTRSGIFSFAAVFILAITLRSNLRTGLALLAGVLVLGYLCVQAPEQMNMLIPSALISRTGDLGGDFFYVRIPLWHAAWDIFLKHPVFGVGFRNMFELLPIYVPDISWPSDVGLTPLESISLGHAHVDSTFFTWLAELGAPGLIAVLWVLGRGLKTLWTLFRVSRDPEISNLAFAFAMGFIAILMNMSCIYAYLNKGCALLIWTCLGAGTVLARLNAQLPTEK